MFASSSIPAAMYTASPRAQLHMMHIQDRLHSSSPFKQRRPPPPSPSHQQQQQQQQDQEREQLPPQPFPHDPNAASFNTTIPHPVAAASGILSRNTNITSPTEQANLSANRQSTRHSLHPHHVYYRHHPTPRSTTPRRSSSAGVSLRRFRRRSGSPQRQQQQQQRPSQGYDMVTLFGFTHDRPSVREASAARSSTRINANVPPPSSAQTQPQQQHQPEEQQKEQSFQFEEPSDLPQHGDPSANVFDTATQEANTQNTAAEGLSFSNTSPSQKALPPTVVAGMKTISTAFIPSIQQSEKSRSAFMGPNASAARLDSSRIVVSEMSMPVENSFHVVLSDPSVSLLISDTDEEEEE